MGAKRELANRLLRLIDSTLPEPPERQQLLDLLQDYHISYNDGQGREDFERQVAFFLGTKQTEGMTKKSMDNYRLYLNMIAKVIQKKSEDISTNDIRSFIAYLGEERGLKNSSIQAVIDILRSFFAWMTIEEIIPKNPMLRIKSFRIDRKNSRHPLTQEELERLRNACKDYREKAIVEFFVSTGCRLSEATQIDVNAIDFERRMVTIVGKGDKVRPLYFSVRAKLMIQEYLVWRKGGDALFCNNRQPYGRLGDAAVQKLVKRIGERAGLPKRVHPHVLRHTFATLALNSGMDITVISQIMGHSNVGTTQIYAEINHESVRREYEKYVA